MKKVGKIKLYANEEGIDYVQVVDADKCCLPCDISKSVFKGIVENQVIEFEYDVPDTYIYYSRVYKSCVDNRAYTNLEEAYSYQNPDQVGIVKTTITDGKLTSVEIVD